MKQLVTNLLTPKKCSRKERFLYYSCNSSVNLKLLQKEKRKENSPNGFLPPAPKKNFSEIGNWVENHWVGTASPFSAAISLCAGQTSNCQHLWLCLRAFSGCQGGSAHAQQTRGFGIAALSPLPQEQSSNNDGREPVIKRLVPHAAGGRALRCAQCGSLCTPTGELSPFTDFCPFLAPPHTFPLWVSWNQCLNGPFVLTSFSQSLHLGSANEDPLYSIGLFYCLHSIIWNHLLYLLTCFLWRLKRWLTMSARRVFMVWRERRVMLSIWVPRGHGFMFHPTGDSSDLISSTQ